MDFGYIFASIMRFYSMGVDALLALPIGIFWTLSSNMERLKAEECRRNFMAFAHAQSGEPQEFIAQLNEKVGDVYVFEEEQPHEEEFDREGMANLRMMLGG